MNTISKYPNKLKVIRKQCGLTQGRVAIHLNMQCESRLSRWEKGLSLPNVENLFKLATLFNVYPHALYPDLFQKNIAALKSPDKLETNQQMN